jgi:hypothetical protein
MKPENSEDNPDLYPALSDISYWEFSPDTSEKYGYYYGIQLDGMDYHITGDGVSIVYRSGDMIHTNLIPKKRFPKDIHKLSEESILHILNLPVEGGYTSKDGVDALYKHWKELGEP